MSLLEPRSAAAFRHVVRDLALANTRVLSRAEEVGRRTFDVATVGQSA